MAQSVFIPQNYSSPLDSQQTELAIKLIKDTFEHDLSVGLCLRRVTAPLFVLKGTGINDDLNGVERKVTFPVKALNDRQAEVVNSLAKWKRMALAKYNMQPGYGILTDMNAIRPDEDLDNIHSLYVDQWDWERSISLEDRNQAFLRLIVKRIYDVLKHTEYVITEEYPQIKPILPEKITFITTEELLQKYPNLTPKQRENEITREFKAVFLMGIGDELSNGEKHDGRAPDYDDWSLNGDILLWNPVLESSFEISSMGIRVDKNAMEYQLKKAKAEDRKELMFHKMLLNNELPLSIGGGIGQSRLCMYFLRKAHIGEVQSSLWGDEIVETCRQNNIYLI
ncbi:MAG: aspartate--ammonia ligase [Bacteroidales bacterium]|nr:aspartate--ammonia ligase [Bacteroidales bacterium]